LFRSQNFETSAGGRLFGMRKRLFTSTPQDIRPRDADWLDLDRVAVVEVTSEQKQYPVESAVVAGEMRGWRAAVAGTQTIRLI
jgi:hypothetical protein